MKKSLQTFWALVIIAIAIGFVIYIIFNRPATPELPEQISTTIEEKEYYPNTGYFKKDSVIYYSATTSPLSGADIATFRTWNHQGAMDKNHVYAGNRIQPGVDAATFEAYEVKNPIRYQSFYKDKNNFYTLSGISDSSLKVLLFDPQEMELIGYYVKANNKIYSPGWEGFTLVEGVDAETFRVLGSCIQVEMSGGSFMIDKNHIYAGDHILEGADTETFEKVADIPARADSEIPYSLSIWKDKDHIYANCGTVIAEADYATFKHLPGNTQYHAEDKNNYYQLNTGGGYNVTPKK